MSLQLYSRNRKKQYGELRISVNKLSGKVGLYMLSINMKCSLYVCTGVTHANVVSVCVYMYGMYF